MKFSGHVQNGTRKGLFIIGRWGYFPHICVGELSCLDEGTLPWRSRGGSSFYVRWGFTSSKVGVHIE